MQVLPLTIDRWSDFTTLFGQRGACGGCWCMTPRLTTAQYERNKGAGNRRAMRRLVREGRFPPGLLGYVDGRAVAWCSIEPRDSFGRLGRSRLLKPVDDRPVWSIVCFFIRREYRGQGLMRKMIEGAVDHARRHGATLVEAYPIDAGEKQYPAVFAWPGLASAFLAAGFREVERRSPTRPILRRKVRP